jgi:hypothetical protein
MKKISLAAAFVLVSGVAAGQSTSETLAVPPYPADKPWKLITDIHDDKHVMKEWIPADQSPDDIADILTEQIFPTVKQSPAEFVNGIFARTRTACNDVRINGPKEQIEDAYPVAYGQVYCVNQKGAAKDVDIFLKVIGGKDSLYVVQREFRRPTTPGAVAGLRKFPKGAADEAQAALAAQKTANDFLVSQVKLCADNACPSATPSPAPANGDDVSPSFGFLAGKTTADEVRDKFGRPNSQGSIGDGRHHYMYMDIKGLIVVFLFGKDDVLIRTRAYSHP